MKFTFAAIFAIGAAGVLAAPEHNNPLFKRECVDNNAFGCSKNGYCWKNCDAAGGWCWTAEGDGTGDWIKCKSDDDCNMGQSCGAGDCDDCGCSC